MARYSKTKDLKLFSEKLKHVSISDLPRTFKVNTCKIPHYVTYEKQKQKQETLLYGFFSLSTKSHTFTLLTDTAQ